MPNTTPFPGDAAGSPRELRPKPPTPEKRGPKPPKAAWVLLLVAALALLIGPRLADRRAAGVGEEYASLAPGQAVASSDTALGAVKPQDYTLQEPAGVVSKVLYAWDWADEDGDVVQVLIDGQPTALENDWGRADLSGAGLRNAPLRVSVPASCTVEIVGVRDGGGGITYALDSANLGRTYLNKAPVGGRNTYRLAPAGS